MINTLEMALAESERAEPFEDRIDILFHELELATKWQRPSLLLAIYSSEFVHGDAEQALENRLLGLGQRARHIVVKSQEDADIPLLVSELSDLNNVVVFVEGLRWGCDDCTYGAYQALNKHREFFIENRVRVVFWLTESEAIHMAHHAPDYWTFRHRVIEFVDSPRPEQIQPQVLESVWQGSADPDSSGEDLDDRITLRTALLSDLPDHEESTCARANLLLTLGILHWRRGDFDPASQFLMTALELAGKLQDNRFEALIHNALALVETGMGRYLQAVHAYRRAVALAPDQISPWNNLGNLHFKLEQYDDALEAFKKAVEKDPKDWVSWSGLGDTNYKLGNNEDAIFAFKKALEFSSSDAHCWCNLANVYAEEGQLDEALVAYQKALEIDRSCAAAWIGLGDVYKQRGKDESAIQAYQTSIEIDPDNAQPWEGLGDVHFNAGASVEAIQAYQKAIELDHAIGTSHNRLASIFLQEGNYAKAVPLLQKGLELEQEPAHAAEMWNQLGDAYRKLNNYENAMAAYRKADVLVQGPQKQTLDAPIDPIKEESHHLSEPVQESHQEETAAPISETNLDAGLSEISFAGPLQNIIEEPLTEASAETSLQGQTEASPEPGERDQKDGSPNFIEMFNDTASMENESDGDFIKWLEGLSTNDPVTAIIDETGTVQTAFIKDEDSQGVETFAAEKSETAESAAEPAETAQNHEEVSETDPADNEALLSAIKEVVARLPHKETDEPIEPQVANGKEDASCTSEPLVEEHAENVEISAAAAIPLKVSGDSISAQIWNELGNIYYNIVNYDEAIKALNKALELDQSYAWTYNNLASIYIHKGDFAEAVPLLQQGIPLMNEAKDKALLWNRLGDTYRRMAQHDKAADAYHKAMELNPENVSLLTRARFSLLGNCQA